jgi:hypothetical protein
VHVSGRPEPPFPALLCPSWLLAGYDLEVGDRVSACGRDGIHVVATGRREAIDHVDAIVDAELGIVLRFERSEADDAAEVIEFRSLTVDPEFDPGRFSAPAGSIVSDGDGRFFGRSIGGVGLEVAKTGAGLAAGGLGAAIRYSPFGPFGALRRSRRQPDGGDTDAAMPRDDPSPGDIADGPAVSDEVLQLLQRGGADVPEFTATLHQWIDPGALLAAIPPSARGAGFGGVGYLIDTLGAAVRQAGQEQAAYYRKSSVHIEGWHTYRIDRTYRALPQPDSQKLRDMEWLTIACDGERHYEVYADRVSTGPPEPPPAELTDLVDGSWLLRCRLSGGDEIMADGRRAYRIFASGSWSVSRLMMFSFPATAVLDAESGRLIRLTCYGASRPAARYELRDITPGGGDARFEAPAGLPIVNESADDDRQPQSLNLVAVAAKATADVIKQRVDEKAAAARSLLESLRAARQPRR